MKTKLKGHQKHITGLGFSTALNTLVSSGADAQVTQDLLAIEAYTHTCSVLNFVFFFITAILLDR